MRFFGKTLGGYSGDVGVTMLLIEKVDSVAEGG